MSKRMGRRPQAEKPLTAKEMQAAALIWEGKGVDATAAACKISHATMYRRMKDQVWLDYVEELRQEHAARIEKQANAARGKIKWGYEEAALFFLNMANTATNEFVKLKAAVELNDLMGIKMRAPVGDSDGPPEKPKFYRSEWMDDPVGPAN